MHCQIIFFYSRNINMSFDKIYIDYVKIDRNGLLQKYSNRKYQSGNLKYFATIGKVHNKPIYEK